MALTANLTPADASGKVQFKDGDDPIGSPVDVANGVAAIQHTFQASGVHSITAVFTAGAGFVGPLRRRSRSRCPTRRPVTW
ncbi:hypothetical protein GS438_13765 [Rhodococcus hoagii]|nr:hypothetical protein [Prescottella equi]